MSKRSNLLSSRTCLIISPRFLMFVWEHTSEVTQLQIRLNRAVNALRFGQFASVCSWNHKRRTRRIRLGLANLLRIPKELDEFEWTDLWEECKILQSQLSGNFFWVKLQKTHRIDRISKSLLHSMKTWMRKPLQTWNLMLFGEQYFRRIVVFQIAASGQTKYRCSIDPMRQNWKQPDQSRNIRHRSTKCRLLDQPSMSHAHNAQRVVFHVGYVVQNARKLNRLLNYSPNELKQRCTMKSKPVVLGNTAMYLCDWSTK